MPENQAILTASATLSSSTLIQGTSIVNRIEELFKYACRSGLVKPTTVDAVINQVTLQTRASAKIAAIIITSNNDTMNKYIQHFMKTIQNA